jgi:hypothetical protein
LEDKPKNDTGNTDHCTGHGSPQQNDDEDVRGITIDLSIGDEHDCRIIYGCGNTTIHSNNVESNIVVVVIAIIHETSNGFGMGLGTTRFDSKTLSSDSGMDA